MHKYNKTRRYKSSVHNSILCQKIVYPLYYCCFKSAYLTNTVSVYLLTSFCNKGNQTCVQIPEIILSTPTVSKLQYCIKSQAGDSSLTCNYHWTFWPASTLTCHVFKPEEERFQKGIMLQLLMMWFSLKLSDLNYDPQTQTVLFPSHIYTKTELFSNHQLAFDKHNKHVCI